MNGRRNIHKINKKNINKIDTHKIDTHKIDTHKIDTHSNDKYLGEGSFGCVLKPEVKCTANEQIINKEIGKKTKQMVSKIFINKEDFHKEIYASKELQNVDKEGNNILLPYKHCETDSKEIFKNSKANNCEELEYYKYKDKHKFYQLIMPYGGIRYDEYFKHNIVSLKQFFYISEPLFKALIDLENNKICHYDIRGANVLVGTDKKAIIIDHSLIIDYNNLYSAKNLRRLQKSYYPYPPECIVYYKVYTDKKDINNFIQYKFEDGLNSYGETRYKAYMSIISNTEIKQGILNIYNKLTHIVLAHDKSYQNELYKFMNNYANMVDVYSVGMLLVTIYKYIDYTGVSKSIKDDFILFIKNLINPDVFSRLTPKDAISTFNKLNSRIK